MVESKKRGEKVMINDTVEECEARLSSLRHIKAFIDMNIEERKIELREAKQRLENQVSKK